VSSQSDAENFLPRSFSFTGNLLGRRSTGKATRAGICLFIAQACLFAENSRALRLLHGRLCSTDDRALALESVLDQAE